MKRFERLRGVEFAEGIPGSVGGGLLMNAGAFGGELSAVVVAITGVHREGRVVRLPGRRWDLPIDGLHYHSVCRNRNQSFTSERGHRGEISRSHDERAQRKRQQTQPHGYPNAGSIFKNPPGDICRAAH